MGAGRRAEAGLAVVLVIIVIVFFLGWLINISQRECKSNKDCNSESYCGSDFACHQYPVIQKTIVQYNLFWPAVAIGIAIIIVAIILKWSPKQKEPKKEPSYTSDEEAEEAGEPYYNKNNSYYKAEGNIKMP